jgi:hypothetical protein
MEWILIIHFYAAAPLSEGSTQVIPGFATEQMCKDAVAVITRDLQKEVSGSFVSSVSTCIQRQ